MGIVIQQYFYMANVQLDSLEEVLVRIFNKDQELSKSVYSYTAGVYATLRTCLEASRKLADEFRNRTRSEELAAFRRLHKNEIYNIINTANDLIKHPIDGESPLFCEPGGYDTVGNIDFNQYSADDANFSETTEVNPRRDLKIALDYLEGLAEIYRKLLPLPAKKPCMKIAICGSLDFTHEIRKVADELLAFGFEVSIPISSEKILRGEFSLEEIKSEKENGTFSERAIRYDSIREYWKKIKGADAILIANFDKKQIINYIGGNSFLEMGFAHVLKKPIYLCNAIPDMIYTDEIRAMQPIVLHGDLTKITIHTYSGEKQIECQKNGAGNNF